MVSAEEKILSMIKNQGKREEWTHVHTSTVLCSVDREGLVQKTIFELKSEEARSKP